jgi:hypothetical protein
LVVFHSQPIGRNRFRFQHRASWGKSERVLPLYADMEK